MKYLVHKDSNILFTDLFKCEFAFRNWYRNELKIVEAPSVFSGLFELNDDGWQLKPLYTDLPFIVPPVWVTRKEIVRLNKSHITKDGKYFGKFMFAPFLYKKKAQTVIIGVVKD